MSDSAFWAGMTNSSIGTGGFWQGDHNSCSPTTMPPAPSVVDIARTRKPFTDSDLNAVGQLSQSTGDKWAISYYVLNELGEEIVPDRATVTQGLVVIGLNTFRPILTTWYLYVNY